MIIQLAEEIPAQQGQDTKHVMQVQQDTDKRGDDYNPYDPNPYLHERYAG